MQGQKHIKCDGHFSYLPNDLCPVIAVRCIKWNNVMKKQRGVNMKVVTTISQVGVRSHLMRRDNQENGSNEASSYIVGDHIKSTQNTVEEIRNVAANTQWYGKLATMEYEKIQEYIDLGLCISPVRSDWLACRFCGRDGSVAELTGSKVIKKHFTQQKIHKPIVFPNLPPDKDTEILENLVREDLKHDDNSHKWVVSTSTSSILCSPLQSLTLACFGIDMQIWLIALADVLIHSQKYKAQWPSSVNALRILLGQLVVHSIFYLGNAGLELRPLLNAISMCPPSSDTIRVQMTHHCETLYKHQYRGLICKGLTLMSESILNNHCGLNTDYVPETPIQNLWFVFLMAVFMNEYFRFRYQKTRVVPVYWKNHHNSNGIRL